MSHAGTVVVVGSLNVDIAAQLLAWIQRTLL